MDTMLITLQFEVPSNTVYLNVEPLDKDHNDIMDAQFVHTIIEADIMEGTQKL